MNTQLFTTRKYKDAHFNQYYSLVSDNDVMQFITGRGLTVEEAQEKFKVFLSVNRKYPEMGYYAVFDVSGQHIGDCKLEWHRPKLEALEVGYILKKEYWGKGYGSKICSLLLKQALDLYPNEDVIGIVDPNNIASKKILQKAGFETYFIGEEDGIPTEKLKFVK